MNREQNGSILVVDDDAFVLDSTALLLMEYNYQVISCKSAEEALHKLRENTIDVVLADIKMPQVSGMQLLEEIRTLDNEFPVILMTAYTDLNTAIDAIRKDAFDFIVKPYKPEYLLHSIEKAVKYTRLTHLDKDYTQRLERDLKIRTKELTEALHMVKDMSREIAHRLTAVAEFRDFDTGVHIKRIGLYAGKIAEAVNMSADFVETIRFASSMHDIGKIGVPDTILLKPGPLTEDEFEAMKTHSTIGAKMLSDSPYPSLQMAATIALTHHEKWDGTGYPHGLKGEEIPMEGRITMIVDHYDALRSKRPYKEPFTHDEACKILIEGSGQKTTPAHFDPRVLKAFIELTPTFEKIYNSYMS